jgi:transcriptional antiterminator NusG
MFDSVNERSRQPEHRDGVLNTSPDRRWYAIRTRSRFEKVVHAQFKHREIEPFLPLLRKRSQWKDRQKMVDWPLFSGYCFAKFMPEQQRMVLQTPGVIQVIGSASVPEPIPDMEIEAMQRVMLHHADSQNWPYHLQEGALITVVGGPLQGLQGRFVRQGSVGQLVLSVHLIQQAVSVTIPASDVREHSHSLVSVGEC